MSTLQQVQQLSSQLNVEEKWQLLSDLIRDLPLSLTYSGIEKTLNVMGGAACIVRTRIPVWLLIGFKQEGWTDAQLLSNYPSLRAQDLVNAWRYYDQNRQEIEEAITKQENF